MNIHTSSINSERANRTRGGVRGSEAEARRPKADALAKVHNLTYIPYDTAIQGVIDYYPDGQFIKVNTPWKYKKTTRKESKRGKIKHFSRKSRSRLMNKFAMLNRYELPYFLTLTYPDKYPSVKQSKKDLHRFLIEMTRKYPNFAYIWRLELQERGAPHFHLFIWGAPLNRLIVNISDLWHRIVGNNDPEHYIRGAKLEVIRSYKGTQSYASKYICKTDETETEEGMGRFWGSGGNIPLAQKVERRVNFMQSVHILRSLRRYSGIKKDTVRCYYVGNCQRWFDNHERLTGGLKTQGDLIPF